MRHLALLSFLLFSVVRSRALPEDPQLLVGRAKKEQTVATSSPDKISGCGPTASFFLTFDNGLVEVKNKAGAQSTAPDVQFPINIHNKDCLDALTKAARTFALALLSNAGNPQTRGNPTPANVENAKKATLKTFGAWISKTATSKSTDTKSTSDKTPENKQKKVTRSPPVSVENKRAIRDIYESSALIARADLQTPEEVTSSLSESEKMVWNWKTVYGNLKKLDGYEKAATVIVGTFPIWYLIDDIISIEGALKDVYHAAVIVFVLMVYLTIAFECFGPVKKMLMPASKHITESLWAKTVNHLAALTHTVSSLTKSASSTNTRAVQNAEEISELWGVLWVVAKKQEEHEKLQKVYEMNLAQQATVIKKLEAEVEASKKQQQFALAVKPQTVDEVNAAWLKLAQFGTNEQVIQYGKQFMEDFMGEKAS